MVGASVILLMGICGSGKSTVGKALMAQIRGAETTVSFLEGDDFHPPANVAKLRAGVPLDDEDRFPWLDALRQEVEKQKTSVVVVSCSALKVIYRKKLLSGFDPSQVLIVCLNGDRQLIATRLQTRQGHFVKDDSLLSSQLATLELPSSDEGYGDVIQVDCELTLSQQLALIIKAHQVQC
jgi:gluconokinase